MADVEFDLSPLMDLDVETPKLVEYPSPSVLAQVVQRPISKRRGKKRSSRACMTCRARKVRCNIVAHGAPCSNCRHDEIECVLPLSRRQRSARERAEQCSRNMSMTGSEAGDLRESPVDYEQCTAHHHDEGLISGYQDRLWERAQSREPLGPHGMNISDHVLAEIIPASSIAPKADTLPIAAASSRTKSWIQIQAPLASVAKEGSTATLPRVFSSFPRHLGPADLSYLRSRDALAIPTESLQVELLKAYIEFVHPNIPLLDLEEFLSAVKYGHEAFDGQRGRGIERENALKKQIPLLLFQAVMFAGVSFVPLRSLKDAGYATRDAAKRVFFSRVRLCYDLDTCLDRQSIIQSLLLMTLTPVATSNENKDAYHWLGLAISLSYSLGLNRGPSSSNLSIRKMRLERRIWWMAFIRDRTLALNTNGTMSRPVRIQREDCDVDMLCLADFDLTDSANDLEEEGGVEMKERQNALACIQKAKICWCSSDVSIMSFGAWCLPVKSAVQPQKIHLPESAFTPHEQIYTSTSYTTSTPFLESYEDTVSIYCIAHTNSSPATSLHDEPTTPQPITNEEPDAELYFEKIIEDEELGGGFGVDGEFDDFLEFLKPAGADFGKQAQALAQARDRQAPRETWAFQFDCENDRVIEV